MNNRKTFSCSFNSTFHVETGYVEPERRESPFSVLLSEVTEQEASETDVTLPQSGSLITFP